MSVRSLINYKIPNDCVVIKKDIIGSYYENNHDIYGGNGSDFNLASDKIAKVVSLNESKQLIDTIKNIQGGHDYCFKLYRTYQDRQGNF